jgi:hypothetical protein
MNSVEREELVYKRAKRRILADMKSGRVPKTIRRFSTLHNYVDANMYLVGWTKKTEKREEVSYRTIPLFNRVLSRLDKWLRNR